MSDFYRRLYREINDGRLSDDFYEALDWLFDDDKFSNSVWGKNDTSNIKAKRTNRLTAELKNQFQFDENNFIYHNVNKDDSIFNNRNRRRTFVAFVNSGSICKEFIRHIRNAIAHSNTRFKGRNYIELKDFDKSGQQTAYMYIPEDSIISIYNCYKRVKRMNL